MNKERVANGAERAVAGGYDAAVARREDDVLRRWPFAADVYQAIVTSPPEWSTRVGVYAPWGVGKTSVLKFVAKMAEADGHLVVWFNPWMHPTSDALWRAFVRAIAGGLRERTGKVARGAWWRGFKSKGEEVGGALAALLSVADDPRLAFAGAVLGQGVGYLRHFFSFGETDVRKLRTLLGEKRLVVLIDDLDRADPRLVPEILLALKEILDVPSVAFVCAFDPKIVGQAMREYHAGFEDGLKFLEKIIDYPCWLPKARREDLERLALHDAARYCPFVPTWAIRRVLPWVASTPRSVRQFVRGLRLLESTARRYREEEVNWVVSLCDQVLQFRLPEGSAAILDDEKFWAHLAERAFAASLQDEEGEKAEADIRARVARLVEAKHADSADVSWLVELLALRNRELNPDFLTAGPQRSLGSLPTAVTGKELAEFLKRQEGRAASADVLCAWLAERENETGSDAQEACLHRLLGRRHRAMLESYDTLLGEERVARLRGMAQIDAWLRVLLLELGRDAKGRHRWTAEDLKALRDEFARSSSSRHLPEEIAQREAEASLLLELVRGWTGDLRVWGEVIGSSVTHGEFDGRGEEWIAVWRRLSEAWNIRLAEELVEEFFNDPELVRRCRGGRDLGDRHVRELLEDAAKVFWQGQRDHMLKGLSEVALMEAARRNAFDLLDGILPEGRRRVGTEEKHARSLLSDQEVAQALFTAATSRRLVAKGVFRLLRAVHWCEDNGVSITLPGWWAGARAEVQAMEKTR